MISRNASYPETPPTSSGGLARAPSSKSPAAAQYRRQKFLDFNRVTPVIAEIVYVGEPHALFAAKVLKLDLALIEQAEAVFECHILPVGIAISKTPDAKLVKVRVPPIESRLNRKVKLVEAPSQRYDQLSPNRRLDVVKGNPEFDCVEFLVDHRSDGTPVN